MTENPGTTWESLPAHLRQQVLHRLPLDDLLRIRAVNRECRQIIDSPQFRLLKDNTSPDKWIVMETAERRLSPISLMSTSTTAVPIRPYLNRHIFSQTSLVCASSGLLLFFSRELDRLQIVNPFTHSLPRTLPDIYFRGASLGVYPDHIREALISVDLLNVGAYEITLFLRRFCPNIHVCVYRSGMQGWDVHDIGEHPGCSAARLNNFVYIFPHTFDSLVTYDLQTRDFVRNASGGVLRRHIRNSSGSDPSLNHGILSRAIIQSKRNIFSCTVFYLSRTLTLSQLNWQSISWDFVCNAQNYVRAYHFHDIQVNFEDESFWAVARECGSTCVLRLDASGETFVPQTSHDGGAFGLKFFCMTSYLSVRH